MFDFQNDAVAQRFAEQHRKFLAEHNPSVLASLKQQGDLKSYLCSVGSQASEMFDSLMYQYQNSPEVAKLPHLQKVQALQSRRHEAEEVILHDIVFQPLPDQK